MTAVIAAKRVIVVVAVIAAENRVAAAAVIPTALLLRLGIVHFHMFGKLPFVMLLIEFTVPIVIVLIDRHIRVGRLHPLMAMTAFLILAGSLTLYFMQIHVQLVIVVLFIVVVLQFDDNAIVRDVLFAAQHADAFAVFFVRDDLPHYAVFLVFCT